MQQNSRCNTSNSILGEEKSESIPITPQDITLMLYLVISSSKDLVSGSLKHDYNF